MPLKQLLGNGSQTTSHAGYVKHIVEMLHLLELPAWSQQQMTGGVRVLFAWFPGGRK